MKRLSVAMALAVVSAGYSFGVEGDYYKYNAGVGAGVGFYELDEEVEAGQLYTAKMGYKFSPRLGVEAGIGFRPFLNSAVFQDDRFALEEDTWGLEGETSVLYYFNGDADKKFDPYLAVTAGVNWYDARMEDEQRWDPFGGVGGGATYWLNDNWGIRGDYRAVLVGHDTEVDHNALVSLDYRWGKVDGAVGNANDNQGSMDNARPASETGTKLHTVYFAFDSAVLTEEAKATLQKNAQWMVEHPGESIVIEGHCDEWGTNDYNMALGERRAKSAFDYLRSLGVAPERMVTISYGEERPVDLAKNKVAWAKNRRVECVGK